MCLHGLCLCWCTAFLLPDARGGPGCLFRGGGALRSAAPASSWAAPPGALIRPNALLHRQGLFTDEGHS